MAAPPKYGPLKDPAFELLPNTLAERFWNECPEICDRIREREVAEEGLNSDLAEAMASFIRERHKAKSLREITV